MIPQVLETTMLICFGFSWPMSVYKNAKAKTAKSMSLQFILLIIVGYVAGIGAKLYTHTVNYVLVVYVLNLVFVSANLVVYFINRQHDKCTANKEETTMIKCNSATLEQVDKYKQVNQVAKLNGVVFFGSSYLYSLPVCELVQDEDAGVTVHNRSIEGLTLDQAEEVLDPCVFSLVPDKVFIGIGEEDIEDSRFNVERFIEQYQWLLYTLHSQIQAKIYIVSVMSTHPSVQTVNQRLQKLAKETGCEYVGIQQAMQNGQSQLKVFDTLRFFLRTYPITFDEAMRIGIH